MSSVKRLKAFLEMFVSWHPRGHMALVGEAPLFVLGDWLDDMVRSCVQSSPKLGVRVMGGSRVEEAERLVSRGLAVEGIVAEAGGWDNIVRCARAFREAFEKDWDMFAEACRKGGRGSLNVRETARKYRVGTVRVARNFDRVLGDIAEMSMARARRGAFAPHRSLRQSDRDTAHDEAEQPVG